MSSTYEPSPDALPSSRAHIVEIQSARKRIAFERAKTIPWYRGKLEGIDAARLDDPEVWQRIPILTKDSLRALDHQAFMREFCAAPPADIAEYWRSGGTTGSPVFYPRTFDDLRHGLVSWCRSFPCIGLGSGDLCHIAFPIGIHPAGQVWARSAQLARVGMAWVGAGNAMPSLAQLDLIQALRPTCFMGMSSFALHLANLAEAKGIDLASSSVKTIICSAETLSAAKREKLSRMWGAQVFDVFGMSEAGLMGAENAAHDGIHIWTDLFYVEVVDPDTGRQVPAGEVGTFCVTPLWTNHATPFLRWNSGDLVSMIDRSAGSGPYAELFPVIRHASRTTGFFKIRGVNVNHAEFEDFIFRNPSVTDFQAVLETDPATDLEQLRVLIEVKRDLDPQAVAGTVREDVKRTFEVVPMVDVLALGTLAAEFERSVKAPRFVDRRG
ncbi:MAG: phenylacetate--CoA ligase [Gammaproteobacteria bacterium]|nr:phenylacetate--CoA ligase [Gammaproteobacteria bacterium]